jgi:hypothetical protein
LGEEMLDSLRA